MGIMKTIGACSAFGLLSALMPITSQADLVTIGQATYKGSAYDMIYDTDSPFGPIVWLDYTSYTSPDNDGTWTTQVAWASSLNGPGILTYNLCHGYNLSWTEDWRLPKTVDGTFDYGWDGTTTAGYNITTSEMGYLYYKELGNKGYYATDGTNPQPGWDVKKFGPFLNIGTGGYKSGTQYGVDTNDAWYFDTSQGSQGLAGKSSTDAAMAVRPAVVKGKVKSHNTVCKQPHIVSPD